MEIPAISAPVDPAGDPRREHEVIERVIRRAEELRKAWSKPAAESRRPTGRSSVAVSA
jgi:predicted nucleic acid-binding Zn ribbon protein